jgi:hypothetical protein
VRGGGDSPQTGCCEFLRAKDRVDAATRPVGFSTYGFQKQVANPTVVLNTSVAVAVEGCADARTPKLKSKNESLFSCEGRQKVLRRPSGDSPDPDPLGPLGFLAPGFLAPADPLGFYFWARLEWRNIDADLIAVGVLCRSVGCRRSSDDGSNYAVVCLFLCVRNGKGGSSVCIYFCFRRWRWGGAGGTGLQRCCDAVMVWCAGPAVAPRRCDGAPTAAGMESAEPGPSPQGRHVLAEPGPAPQGRRTLGRFIVESEESGGVCGAMDIGGRRGMVDADDCGEDDGGEGVLQAIRRWPEPGPAARDTIGRRLFAGNSDRRWPEPGPAARDTIGKRSRIERLAPVMAGLRSSRDLARIQLIFACTVLAAIQLIVCCAFVPFFFFLFFPVYGELPPSHNIFFFQAHSQINQTTSLCMQNSFLHHTVFNCHLSVGHIGRRWRE